MKKLKTMTVQKRLSRSNTWMIVLTVTISLLLTWTLMNVFLYATEPEVPDDSAKIYENTVAILQAQGDAWGEENAAEPIIETLETLNLSGSGGGLSVSVYRGDERVYAAGDGENPPYHGKILDADGNYFLNQELYAQQSGDYTIYLLNNHTQLQQRFTQPGILLFWPLAALLVVAVVMIVNRLLTRYVIRHIVDPLHTLKDGVHELQDGNLRYRIAYAGEDEFSGVCDDFNEMAGQLSALMEERKRDDENRRELIAGISHDLRTPLTSIKAYVEGIEQGVASTPAMQAEYLGIIKAKTDDLEHIVRQLFRYSKLDTGAFPFKMENADIGRQLRQYIEQAKDEYERRGLTVTLGDNAEGAVVLADTVQLRAVFTNILENAAKYGAAEGKRLAVSCRREGDAVHLRFQDNGPGTSEEALGKLFSAFYRSDPARKNPGRGSGLGLAISRKIIEHFGGGITAENVGGLCIHIILPVTGGTTS